MVERKGERGKGRQEETSYSVLFCVILWLKFDSARREEPRMDANEHECFIGVHSRLLAVNKESDLPKCNFLAI